MIISDKQVLEQFRAGAKLIHVDLNKYKGHIPSGYDLVEYESGSDPMSGLVLYGFDEVGMFNLKSPAWVFMKIR